MGKTFIFEASWDPEAKVWWTSETPVQGLVTEAATLDELHNKLSVMIPEMLKMRTVETPLSIQVNSLRECLTA